MNIMTTTSRLIAIILLFGVFFSMACSSNSATEELTEASVAESFELQLVNDPSILDSRVTFHNEELGLKHAHISKISAEVTNITATRLYTVSPPSSVDNLSATHTITNLNNSANILYHRNDPSANGTNAGYAGAIQFINPTTGVLRQEAITNEFEWNHLHPANGVLYITGDAPRGASFFSIPLFDNTIPTADNNTVVNLFGPSGNASWVSGDIAYVSVGGSETTAELEDGRGVSGLYALNLNDLNQLPVIEPLTGLKTLYSASPNVLAMRNTGTETELRSYSNDDFANLVNLTPSQVYGGINTLPDPLDGRNGIFVDGTIAYIPLGNNGLVAYDLDTQAVIDQIDFNGVGELGGPVNSVYSFATSYLFVSAGSALVLINTSNADPLIEAESYYIPLSSLVGDFNNDGFVNVNDITDSGASINYATPTSRVDDNGNMRVMVSCGRIGVVTIEVNLP